MEQEDNKYEEEKVPIDDKNPEETSSEVIEEVDEEPIKEVFIKTKVAQPAFIKASANKPKSTLGFTLK